MPPGSTTSCRIPGHSIPGLSRGRAPVSLNAEDIIQGYRIDVWDSRRDHWFPLCRRIAAPHPGPGGYAIGKPPVIEPVPSGVEGWVELGLASAGDQSSTDQCAAGRARCQVRHPGIRMAGSLASAADREQKDRQSVQPKPGIRGFPPPMPGLVTQYGPDPIVISGPVKTTPKLADYPLAGRALHLAEQPSVEVNVAGHPVSFDAGRGLWFADIAVNAGAGYWPFVRLALVRYQPSSLTGAEISRVTQADFAQLAPDRVATVTFPSKTSAHVSVIGHGYSKGPQGGASDEMVVTWKRSNRT
jgi:hypothetical protein